MDLNLLVSNLGSIGSFIGGMSTTYDVFISKKQQRITLLQNELKKLLQGKKINHEISDEEYNLFNYIVYNAINYGTKAKIKHFAKIAHDVFFTDYLDISRGDKFVYLVNQLSDQEIAFLTYIYKNIDKLNDKGNISNNHTAYVIIPNSKGDYQTIVKEAFTNIGIANSERIIVLKKLDHLGILQYEDTFLKGGIEYSISEFGQEFIKYLLDSYGK